MRRIISHATLVALLAACDSPAAVVASRNSPPTPTPTPPAPVATIRVSTDTAGLFVGELRHLSVLATDQNGNRVSTDHAVVTSSNTSVVTVTETSVVTSIDSRTGLTWQDVSPTMRLVAPGSAMMRVSLPGVGSDSILVLVRPQPPSSTSMMVDSFTVVEYRASCAWACPYLVYAPLLKLRESTGKSTAEVVEVQFTLGDKTTGVCRGSVVYTPGLSAQLNGIYDYLWSNDLILVSLDGHPFAGDIATAHVIVRDANGNYSQLTATGSVQRMVSNPVLPPPRDNGWDCLGYSG